MTLTSHPIWMRRSWSRIWDGLSRPLGLFNSTKIILPPGNVTILSGTPRLPGDTNFSHVPPKVFTLASSASSIFFSNIPDLRQQILCCMDVSLVVYIGRKVFG